jgi:hypothetical protein
MQAVSPCTPAFSGYAEGSEPCSGCLRHANLSSEGRVSLYAEQVSEDYSFSASSEQRGAAGPLKMGQQMR